LPWVPDCQNDKNPRQSPRRPVATQQRTAAASQACSSTRGLLVSFGVKPCPRCGSTRTDSVDHGLVYALVWKCGYRLRRCSRCRSPRFIPRHIRVDGQIAASHADVSSPGGPPPTTPESPPRMRRGIEGVDGAVAAATREPLQSQADEMVEPAKPARDPKSCPRCGSKHYHRSRRSFFEHLLLRPKMARCNKCRYRFPHPGW
jgi:hypothetical protein